MPGVIGNKTPLMPLLPIMEKNNHNYTLFLLFALFLSLIWVNSPNLADYSLQLTAGLIIFLAIAHKIFSNREFVYTESMVSTIAVVLVVSATGGLTSPFFFLNYFLLFELSLLLAPSVSVSLTLGLILFYLFTRQLGASNYNLIILFSFFFMTPLAYLSGKFYRRQQIVHAEPITS